MSRLLKVELKNIFSKFDIQGTILIFILLGFAMGIINKSTDTSCCDGLLEWTMVVTIIISALGGLYISRDYTQNTIRNKIIVGHDIRLSGEDLFSALADGITSIGIDVISIFIINNKI